jgi:hypothetical protein
MQPLQITLIQAHGQALLYWTTSTTVLPSSAGVQERIYCSYVKEGGSPSCHTLSRTKNGWKRSATAFLTPSQVLFLVRSDQPTQLYIGARTHYKLKGGGSGERAEDIVLQFASYLARLNEIKEQRRKKQQIYDWLANNAS